MLQDMRIFNQGNQKNNRKKKVMTEGMTLELLSINIINQDIDSPKR